MTNILNRITQSPERSILGFIILLTLVRVFLLFTSDINLGPDEAQYWWWSKEFQFGYYSKPPMIAWLIGLTTSVFGDAEWAVRLSSPFLIGGTAWLLFLIGKTLYNLKVATWTAITWMIMPIITMGSSILSTDIPLLFFWSLSIFGLIKVIETQDIKWVLITGIAFGLGLMSKYAMVYFPLCIGLAFVFSSYVRNKISFLHLGIIAGTAILIFIPNLIWNAGNDFQTLAHTQDNANWGKNSVSFDELQEFFFAQFGVAGPVIFGSFLWGLITYKKRKEQAGEQENKDVFLLCFALPPLVIICIQAFVSHANANWAMTAYPAATLLIVAWLTRLQTRLPLFISTGIHASLAVLFMVLSSNFALVDQLGRANDIKRVRAWEAQATDITPFTKEYDIIVVDDRELMGSLLYYMRNSGKTFKAWDLNRHVDNHYEAFHKLDPSKVERALLISKYPQYLYRYVEYDNILEVGTTSIDTGVKCKRQYSLYELSGYNPAMNASDIVEPEIPVSRKNGDCRPY